MSKLTFYTLLSILLFLSTASTQERKSLSLSECYRLSLDQSERIRIKGEEIQAAEARYRQALGAIMPSIGISLNSRLRNGQSVGGNFDNFGGPREDRFETALTLEQPIFSGFRDLILIRALTLEVDARKSLEKRERELLYLDLAQLFYQMLWYEDDLKELARIEEVLKERVSELENWLKLGKSRASEVLSANADLHEVLANKERNRGAMLATKELLSFLLGLGVEDFSLSSTEESIGVFEIRDLELKGGSRQDLVAATSEEQGRQKELQATKRKHWPVISMQGNVYPYESPDIGREWNLLFKFELPVFEGGRIEAEVSEKEAALRIAELRKQQLAREINSEIRSSYEELLASQRETLVLGELVKAAEADYQSQQADYSAGTVTNLDVLSSIDRLQKARRRLIRAVVDVKLSRVKLKVAVGGIEE